jgi:CRISPR-associated protein Csy2
MRRFLLIPHLKIHNANAMSSPYTIGFPAITAWLGAVHALQRKIDENGFAEVKLLGTAISCHDLNLQTYKGRGDYVSSIIATANPLNKDGSRPAFIEEVRCHLEVSLLLEYQGLDPDNLEKFKNFIEQQLQKMKFAGGDVLSFKPVKTENADEDDEASVRKILRKLMLGYVIIERRDLIKKSMETEGKDALEALLDHLKIMHRSTKNDQEEVSWNSSKKEAGWLVPIAVGFQAISEIGFAKNQRDSSTPHRFAESVVTLGEFVMAHRIKNLDDMLWQYHVEQDLYLCQTNLKLTK